MGIISSLHKGGKQRIVRINGLKKDEGNCRDDEITGKYITVENKMGTIKDISPITGNPEKGLFTRSKSTPGAIKAKSTIPGNLGKDLLTRSKSTPSQDEHIMSVLSGFSGVTLKTGFHVIRIFKSSTFTDTAEERNILMERVYPKVRRHCQRRGYEFNVVDMRWGIRDEATNDHSTLGLCLEEIRTCQQLSTGVSFVSLLGQKYGYRPLPPEISKSEFDLLRSKVQDDVDCKLLSDWYVCDTNRIPPAYVLQPVSSVISNEKSLESSKSQTWQDIAKRLMTILRSAAVASGLDQTALRKYFWSITDAEIECGLTGKNPTKSFLWFNRSITDLSSHSGTDDVTNFVDKSDEGACELLEALKKRMIDTLPPDNIYRYNVTLEEAVEPQNEGRLQYLSQFCQDFYKELVQRVDKAIQRRAENDINLPVYEEAVQHLVFAESKCQSFYGREEQLEQIRDYLKGNSRYPLVVYGESGSGKTSLMSKAAMSCNDWLQGEAYVIIRYLGTTPASSIIRKLISSLSEQLTYLYRQPWYHSQSENFKVLHSKFMELLDDLPDHCREKKLVIFLDSLDQLSADDNALELNWVPLQLPENVKLVLSTLPDDQYVCFPVLKSLLPESCFVSVPRLPADDARHILQNWMSQSKRTLTVEQTNIVLEAFSHCSLPIFLRISIDEALRWKSYTPPNETVLQATVRGAINSLFQRVERRHGQLLVRRALAYITAAKAGLTETELEDVLSCDDEVLEDVFQYWIPPVRRIPPLLWLRIKRDLSLYLVDRGADESTVVTWYHRQFIEAATERYLADKKEVLLIHSNLADYFLGTWASGNKKPFKSREGMELSMDRLVSPQPIFFTMEGDSMHYNIRKLSELPFHLIKSKRLDTLKQECLCHYEFLLGLLRARSFQDMLDNFDHALLVFPDDMALSVVRKTLKLSNNALSLWPGQLASQLLSRLPREYIDKSVSLQRLEDQARAPSVPALIPNQVCLVSPGGALVDSLSGLADLPSVLVTSDDGKLIVCACGESGLYIWETSSGKLVKSIKFHAKGVIHVALPADKSLVIVASSGLLRAWNLQTGQLVYSRVKGTNTWMTIVQVNGRESLIFLDNNTFEILSVKTGDTIKSFTRKVSNRPLFVSVKDNLLMIAQSGINEHGPVFNIEIFDLSEEAYIQSYTMPYRGNIQRVDLLSSSTILLAKVRKNSVERAKLSVASASNCMDISLNVCNLTSNYKLQSLINSKACVRYYALTKDKSKATLLCNSEFVERNCSFQAVIKIVNLSTMAVKNYLLNYPSTIIHLGSCRDTFLVTASLDKIVRIWDINALSVRREKTGAKEEEEDFIVCTIKEPIMLMRSFALKDGTTSVMTWNIAEDAKHFYRGLINPTAFLLSQEHMILMNEQKLVLYSTGDGSKISSVDLKFDKDEGVSLHILSTDHVALIHTVTNVVEIYDVPALQKTKVIPLGDKGEIYCFTPVSGSFELFAVGLKARSADSERSECLVAITTIRDSQKPAYVYYGHFESNFEDLSISVSGTTLLDVLYDSRKELYRVAIWHVETRHQIFVTPPKDPCHVAILSNDGSKFFAAHWDGSMSCWSISADGILVTPLWNCRAHSGPVHKIFLAEDGNSALTIAGGFNSKDRSIRLWNCLNGTLDAEFTPDVKISSLCISSKLDLIVVEIQDQVVLFQVVRGRMCKVESETPASL